MLKLIYTEDGLILESVASTLETLVSQRLQLALAAAQPFYVESSTATLLLNLDSREFVQLQNVITQDKTKAIQASVLEGDCIEVTLKGTWVTNIPDSESGIFLASLGKQSERLVQDYWEISELQVA